MSWLPVFPHPIPADLRAQPSVLWRAEPSGKGKSTKVPYRIAEPSRKASSTDPATWGSFDDAFEAYLSLVEEPADPVRGPIAGIGVVLTREAGITCIDLDRVIEPGGALAARAEAVIRRYDSWAEISPSGTGIHIFVYGRVPRAVKGTQVELYSDARYIAVTGYQWPGTPDHLQPRQDFLDHLVRLDARTAQRRPHVGPSTPPPDDLAGALRAKLERWKIPVARIKRWGDGYLAELVACPWGDEHTAGRDGAAAMIHASGAFDFTCLHAHCGGRGWREFRAVMEGRAA